MAMSGGVDSSVAALVLLEAGYDVAGATMHLFSNEDACLMDETLETLDGSEESGKTCCSLKDVEDARQVCLGLGIEHFVYNMSRAFNECVIDRFCDSYLAGETPNPCIDCNRYLKFEALQQRRRDLGFDFVATGHYARRAYNEETGRYELLRAVDGNKDQSYVLHHLTQDTLAHMLFPLGDMTKPRVREVALAHGFVNANKSESQDICFVPDGDYASFIERRRSCTFDPGPIVLRDGTQVGTHRGLVHYTVGQRKGIGVAYSEPLYVFAKNAAANELVVDVSSRAVCTALEVRDVNFISRAALPRPEHFTVKAHYRQKPQGAIVEQLDDDRIRIEFDAPQRACAPGQSAVVYDGDTVVCGGTIARSL